jgi:hypothetical protein
MAALRTHQSRYSALTHHRAVGAPGAIDMSADAAPALAGVGVFSTGPGFTVDSGCAAIGPQTSHAPSTQIGQPLRMESCRQNVTV